MTMEMRRHPAFQHFAIGDLQGMVLDDGFSTVPALASAAVDPEELADFLASMRQSTEFRHIPISCLLVRSKTHGNILVDSGMGHQPGSTAGKLPRSLRAAGLSPSDIDVVLISHIHVDHVGGLLGEDGAPLFANAVHYISQQEFDFWSGDPKLDRTLMSPQIQRNAIETARLILQRLAETELRRFTWDMHLLEGVHARPLCGRTPGHTGYLFDTESPRKLLYTGDAISHPFISIKRLQWRFPFDVDAPGAIATRRELIALLIETGWLAFTPHFPWPAVGQVMLVDGEPCWMPAGL